MDSLTPRELEVHRLLEAGLSNHEIGLVLHSNPGVVKVHVHRVVAKTGINPRAQENRIKSLTRLRKAVKDLNARIEKLEREELQAEGKTVTL